MMDRRGIDLALVTCPKNVYYLSAYLPLWTSRSALILDRERCILVSPGDPPSAIAMDEVRSYDGSVLGTVKQEQQELLREAVAPLIREDRRLGIDALSNEGIPAPMSKGAVNLNEELWGLRRRKEEDERALIEFSAGAAAACYERAREIIRPGLTELELYSELHRTAVHTLGTPIGQFGNDFQCGTPGGPPRLRAAEAGELWILDLGIEYCGYFSDTCRTFAVEAPPTDLQMRSWEKLSQVLRDVEQRVKPGVSCRSLYVEVKQMLDGFMPGAFVHHLGHGFGLTPHEAPHLNPHWDDVFEVGDTFTVEPGLYHETLRGGIRLENDYLVTPMGVVNLTPMPLGMASAKESG